MLSLNNEVFDPERWRGTGVAMKAGKILLVLA
jgi:hypothetical protein